MSGSGGDEAHQAQWGKNYGGQNDRVDYFNHENLLSCEYLT